MEEEWRPVVGFETYYEVSNTGKVRRLDSHRIYSKNGIKFARFVRGKELIFTKGNRGYLVVYLQANGKKINTVVHRLVAEAFLPNPLNKEQVNHKNGIKTDNNLENLEWVTPAENIHHAIRTGLMKTRKTILQIKNGVVINEYESIKDAGNAIIEEYQKTRQENFAIRIQKHKLCGKKREKCIRLPMEGKRKGFMTNPFYFSVCSSTGSSTG